MRASTPSNAAEILVPDKREILRFTDESLNTIFVQSMRNLDNIERTMESNFSEIHRKIGDEVSRKIRETDNLASILDAMNPREILKRGYAIARRDSGEILRNKPRENDRITVETLKFIIESEVKNVRAK